jgi:hypothetical protein
MAESTQIVPRILKVGKTDSNLVSIREEIAVTHVFFRLYPYPMSSHLCSKQGGWLKRTRSWWSSSVSPSVPQSWTELPQVFPLPLFILWKWGVPTYANVDSLLFCSHSEALIWRYHCAM